MRFLPRLSGCSTIPVEGPGTASEDEARGAEAGAREVEVVGCWSPLGGLGTSI